jgi:hypothetical protein
VREPDDSRPSVCDPQDQDNCVEFCTALAPACALPWTNAPACVFDSELGFRRAVFDRDASDRPEVTLNGRVADEAGKRIEGALVRVWVSWRHRYTHLLDEVSGKEGAFRVRLRTGPWSYALRVSYPGLASEVVEPVALDRNAGAGAGGGAGATGGGPRISIRLAPEQAVRGRVVDDAHGVPVPGALVQAVRTSEDGLDVAETRSGEDGSFVLGGLEPRRYFLRVSKFGWVPPNTRSPTVAPAARVTLKMARTNVIRGVVHDAYGEPAPNAMVAAVLSGVPGSTTYTLTTDAEGNFAYDRFSVGTYFLWARRGDMLVYPPEKIELAKDQEATVNLSLKHQGARITGRVQARTGYVLGPAARALLHSRSPLAFPRPAVGAIAEGGEFVIAGVLPGRYEITVRDGGRPLVIAEGPREVEVPIEPKSTVALPAPVVVRAPVASE